ncbi:Zn-ribbon domain-containing OB-fold protein [Mycobacterium sp. BMJ-28]
MTILRWQTDGIPLPEPTVVSQPFWDGCVAHELRYQRCSLCGLAEFDPVWACRGCGGEELDWRLSGGRGEIYSHTVVWRPQTPAFSVPYAVVIVTFDEGFSMLTNLVGCLTEEVRIGLRVRVLFNDVAGATLPCVEPDAEDPSGN